MAGNVLGLSACPEHRAKGYEPKMLPLEHILWSPKPNPRWPVYTRWPVCNCLVIQLRKLNVKKFRISRAQSYDFLLIINRGPWNYSFVAQGCSSRIKNVGLTLTSQSAGRTGSRPYRPHGFEWALAPRATRGPSLARGTSIYAGPSEDQRPRGGRIHGSGSMGSSRADSSARRVRASEICRGVMSLLSCFSGDARFAHRPARPRG